MLGRLIVGAVRTAALAFVLMHALVWWAFKWVVVAYALWYLAGLW